MYKGIGVCIINQIIEPADLEKMYKYYLLWHKPNYNKKNSYQSTSTKNFQISEYINQLLFDPKIEISSISCCRRESRIALSNISGY